MPVRCQCGKSIARNCTVCPNCGYRFEITAGLEVDAANRTTGESVMASVFWEFFVGIYIVYALIITPIWLVVLWFGKAGTDYSQPFIYLGYGLLILILIYFALKFISNRLDLD
jgi:hypothetical protein